MEKKYLVKVEFQVSAYSMTEAVEQAKHAVQEGLARLAQACPIVSITEIERNVKND